MNNNNHNDNNKISESKSQFILPKIPSKRTIADQRVSHRGNGSSDSGAETSDSDDRTYCAEAPGYSLQCSFCAYSPAGDVSGLVSHLKSCHSAESLQCGTCRQLLSLDDFHRHASRCKGSHYCDWCRATFAQKSYLQRHIARIHLKSNSGFVCETCGQILSSNNNLKQHKLIHTDNIKFTCEYCNKGFYQKIHYHTHLDSKHSKTELASTNKPFICLVCNEQFLFQTSLQQHLNQYCFKKERRFMCGSCEKSFIYPSELKRHEQVHLSKYDRIYSCPYCSKSYNRLYQFVEHLFFHKNTSAFKCPKCGKILQELSYLKKHYKRHFIHSTDLNFSDKNDPVLTKEMRMDDDVIDNDNLFNVEDNESAALIDSFIEEVWDRFQPYLSNENSQTISFDDLKLDIWEEFCNE